MRRAILIGPVVLLVAVCASSRAGDVTRLHLTFEQRSPWSAPDEMSRRFRIDERLQPNQPDQYQKRNWEYDLPTESFEAVVPPAYKPDGSYGLLVWTGGSAFSPEWYDVLARHKLLFIEADKKEERGTIPAGLWLDAVHNMKQRYAIDAQRIYTCGFSNGGRSARSMVIAYPDVFHGCICLAGDDFYVAFPKNEVTDIPAGEIWQGPLDRIKKEMRLVLMRGERDTFTPAEGRAQGQALLIDGFEHVSFFVVPGLGHQNAPAVWFEKDVDALDRAPSQKPPTTAPSTQPNPLPGQMAQARRLLNSARYFHTASHPGNPGPRETRRYLRVILDQYLTTPAAKDARELLSELDAPALATQRIIESRDKGAPPLTGVMQLAFTERSPLNFENELRDKGVVAAPDDLFSPGWQYEKYNLADEVYEVAIPASYRAGSPPQGVLVWMGVTKFPKPWLDVLARHRLILLAPHLRGTMAAGQLPLDGIHNLRQLYSIDAKRIYVAGVGQGRRWADVLGKMYPEVFTAGVIALPKGLSDKTASGFEKVMSEFSRARAAPATTSGSE